MSYGTSLFLWCILQLGMLCLSADNMIFVRMVVDILWRVFVF